ncbi:hypothetical protein C8J56DRAFT_971291 [Mycena floridula]|nr:hypothetical protein C8J56DRAFT_971291 [Mycena floridula]
MLPAPRDVSPTNHLAEGVDGPILVGVFFSTVLYGVNIVQRFIWTRGLVVSEQMCWSTLMFRKVLCLFLCITSRLHSIWLLYINLLSSNLVGPPHLRRHPLLIDIDLGHLHSETTFWDLSTPVQLLMAWRIMVVTETRLWTCIIVAIAMLSFGRCINILTIQVSFKPNVSHVHELRAPALTWLVSSAVTDLIITGVWLFTGRKSGYNTSLDTYVNRIIRLGLVTIPNWCIDNHIALSDALVLIVLKAYPSTAAFLGFGTPYLYISTILSSLNARDSWTNSENALLPASSNDVYSQKFWGSVALHNPAHIDIEMPVPELNGEIGVQDMIL